MYDFDGDMLLEEAVIPISLIDGAHAAPADLPHDPVDSHPFGRTFRFQEGIGIAHRQQRFHFAQQLRLRTARTLDEGRTRFRLQFQGVGGDLLDALPVFRSNGSPHANSRRSHKRATFHSRLMVAGERSNTSATSSMLRPPKTRNSTMRS